MGKSIKAKLVIVTGMIVVIALGILGLMNYYNAEKMVLDDNKENLTSITLSLAGNVGGWLQQRQAETEALANTPTILRGDKGEIVSYLNSEVKRNPRYLRFFVTDIGGNAYFNTGVTANLADRGYFKKVMATGKSVISDPVVGRGGGETVILVCSPIKRDGKVVGVFGGTVALKELIQRVDSIKIGKTGYAFAKQSDGLTIIHPDEKVAMKSNSLKDKNVDPKLREATQRGVRGETGITEYTFNGTAKYVAFAPIPGVSWSLYTNVPVSEITEKLGPFRRNFIVTTLVILIFTSIAIYLFARKIAEQIRELSDMATSIAKGDLSVNKIELDSKDELGLLASASNDMKENLRRLIGDISAAAAKVAASSKQLTICAEQSAQAANQVADTISTMAAGTDKQVESIDEAAKIIQEISRNVEVAAADSDQATKASGKTAQAAASGSMAIDSVVKQMNTIERAVSHSADIVARLGDQSRNIGTIVDTISGIAKQTNLLALNAAIEAARAGEQGRGFAVVAEEVRKLAEQSEDATNQIAALINAIQADTDDAVSAMSEGTREVHVGSEVVNTAGTAFAEISRLVDEVSGLDKRISQAVERIKANSQGVVSAINRVETVARETSGQTQTVSAATQEQSASMEEIAGSSRNLAELADHLGASVSIFKI